MSIQPITNHQSPTNQQTDGPSRHDMFDMCVFPPFSQFSLLSVFSLFVHTSLRTNFSRAGKFARPSSLLYRPGSRTGGAQSEIRRICGWRRSEAPSILLRLLGAISILYFPNCFGGVYAVRGVGRQEQSGAGTDSFDTGRLPCSTPATCPTPHLQAFRISRWVNFFVIS